ncbi:MAG: flagellar FliJ family protein [Betaproteobacteria bacterium]
MSALSSMQLAVELAARQRDQRLQDVAQAQQQCLNAQQQFDLLQGYAQETQARWVNQSRNHLTPELLRHYYQFMDKLHQAIAMQTQASLDAAQRLAQEQALLLQTEFTLASRQTVRDAMRRAARARSDKIEQKQLDEMAALQHRRNCAQPDASLFGTDRGRDATRNA